MNTITPATAKFLCRDHYGFFKFYASEPTGLMKDDDTGRYLKDKFGKNYSGVRRNVEIGDLGIITDGDEHTNLCYVVGDVEYDAYHDEVTGLYLNEKNAEVPANVAEACKRFEAAYGVLARTNKRKVEE